MDTYEIFALHYASLMRPAAENFLFRDLSLTGDAHDLPMPLEYFVWVVRNEHRTILVDTGFDYPAGSRRGRTLLYHPADMLRGMGLDPNAITNIIITHLHYDHAGNLGAFPNATFHLQDAEMAFATGRCMCHSHLRSPFEVEDVVMMVRRVYEERVRFHDGDAELFPGLSLHKVPGHSAGLQCVRVATRRGYVVLASDASHFYANIARRNPFPIVVDIAATMESWDRLRSLADSDGHIIPGHDGLVLELYPQARIGSVDLIRLDQPPKSKPSL